MPDRDADSTLGSALRAARESAGRTVEQVAADTRIRATLIRDLEADRLDSSGGRVYARGHVKSIAATLYIDPAELLALFDRAQGPADDGLPVPRSASSLATPVTPGPSITSFAAASSAALRPEHRGPRWGLALAGAAVLLLGITGVGLLQQPDSTGSTSDLAGAGALATPTPAAPQPAAVPSAEPDLSAAKPAVTGAQLRLRLIGGTSWVSVRNAGATLFEGVLKDGEFRDFQDATRLKVIVGNAVAVNLNCGGVDSGPAGASGAVRRFECTAEGLHSLNA